MAEVNQNSIKILSRLIRCGYVNEKEIASMGISDLINIPKISPAEIVGINELQKAIKTGTVLSFFVSDDNMEVNYET